MHLIIWNLLYNLYIGVYQPIFECRDKGFNFLEKGLKNDLETYFEKKNSPFAKLRPRAKHITVHALSLESQALSAQPLHLKMIHSTKLAKVELSQIQFDLDLAKQKPNR